MTAMLALHVEQEIMTYDLASYILQLCVFYFSSTTGKSKTKKKKKKKKKKKRVYCLKLIFKISLEWNVAFFETYTHYLFDDNYGIIFFSYQ